jgi:hypothetical protein
LRTVIAAVLIAFLPFLGYVPSSMSIEAFSNIDHFKNIIFNNYDFQYFGGQRIDNSNFYLFGIIFSIFNLLKINIIYIGYIWYVGIFLFGAIGISELIKIIALKSDFLLDNFKKNALILFFIFNYYTVTQIDNGYLIFPYLLMPSLIAASLKYSESKSKKFLLALIILSNLNTTQITLNIINLLIMVVIVSHYNGILKAFKCSVIIFGSSLWFWGSYLISALSPSKAILFAATDESFSFYNRTTEFFEIIRLLGNWAVSDNALPVAKLIGDNFLGTIIGFIPLLTLVLLWRHESIKFKKSIAFFILIAMGSNPSSPLYFIWNFISNNYNFFNVFRNTYKFVGPLALLFCINYIFIKELRLIKFLYIYIIYVILTIYIVNIHPLNSRYYSTPKYWIDAEEYIINTLDDRDNILLLPFENNSIFVWGSYNGFMNGSPLNIENPILFRSLSSTNNFIVDDIRNKFIDNNPCEILKKNNIKLIINRNDMISKEYFNISDINCGFNYKKFGPLELINIKYK